MEKIEAEKRKALRAILSPGALERLSRIKLVKPLLASQLENYLFQLYASGKINRVISEKEMIKILENLNSGKKRFRIIR